MATPIPTNAARFTLPELVLATGGKVLAKGAAAGVAGISTDSRAVAKGQAFVALKGEKFDGHDHVAAAVERGAALVVVSKKVEVPSGVGVLKVDDTLAALGGLAAAHRHRWSNRGLGRPARWLIGITGSAGKTTTRHAVTRALSSMGYGVHASVGNLNNAIGVPMTLLGLTEDHRVGVIEIGMNVPGEIGSATRLCAPDAACVTLVSDAHTEGVGSIWGVLREKSEIFAQLPERGVAVVNADDEMARATLARASCARRILYGEAEDADVRLVERRPLGLRGSELLIEVCRADEGALQIESVVPLLGRAGAYAALATLALVVGLDIRGCRDRTFLEGALSSLSANEPGRLTAYERSDGVVILDDAYNANPASMRASLQAAREIATALERRLILVVGAMFELGKRSDALHEEIGRAAADVKPELVIVVGSAAEPLARGAEAAGAKVARVEDASSAETFTLSALKPHDLVLVKASNSVGLSSVADRLNRG